MKKVLTLAVALLVFGASTSMAQGLGLHWNECGSAGGAITAPALNCAVNTGAALTLVCSVTPGTPIAQFAAATAVLDISVAGGTLPLWWQTNAGQCRANAISMSFDPANNPGGCADLWGGNPNLQVTQIQQGVNGPNRVRVNGVAALPAGSEIAVAAGSELYVCQVRILKANTTTCAGCADASTMVLNEVKLQSPSAPDQRIVNPADNYCLGLSGGLPACPGATPAQNKTWGSVKNLYR